MISRSEVLMGREVEYPLTPKMEENLGKLLVALNKLRAKYNKPMSVSSGYRPGKYNTAAKGAAKSAHLTCEACDFRDPDGAIDKFCMDNQQLLAEWGLWLEHPDSTPGWCHLDTRPRSNRVFKP
jgi:hypothetical protein